MHFREEILCATLMAAVGRVLLWEVHGWMKVLDEGAEYRLGTRESVALSAWQPQKRKDSSPRGGRDTKKILRSPD